MFSVGDIHFGPVYMNALFGFHNNFLRPQTERERLGLRNGASRIRPAFFMYRRTIPEKPYCRVA